MESNLDVQAQKIDSVLDEQSKKIDLDHHLLVREYTGQCGQELFQDVHAQKINFHSNPDRDIGANTEKCSKELVQDANLYLCATDSTNKHSVHNNEPNNIKNNIRQDFHSDLGFHENDDMKPISVLAGPSSVCSEQFSNSPDHFETGHKNVTPTENLADSFFIQEDNETNQEQTISSELKTMIDNISNHDHDESLDNFACVDDVDVLNLELEVEKPDLVESTSASNEDNKNYDITLRDKTETGQHNVVVIKLHESAHEDFADTDFTDFEPVHCSYRDLVTQMQQQAINSSSDCHDNNFLGDASGRKTSAMENSEVSENVAGTETVLSEDRNESEDFFFVDDEPIHMSLDEVLHMQPHRHGEPRSVITSSATQRNTAMLASNAVPSFRNEDQTEPSNELTTSDYHEAFMESMSQLKDCGWYWGPLSYSEAQSMLMTKPDGSFLVRDSSSENYILSLSFKCMGTVCHTRIEHHKGVFSFFSQPESHGTSTIRKFIEQAVEFSHTGQFLYFLRPLIPGSPPVAIQLLYPVSRFLKVPSLQHMCRFLILRWVRRDHIDNLPVPEKVKNYLREHQYYVENLEDEGVLVEREERRIRSS
ncbi:uncharacterized protein LOC121387070 [Gigantopelta aegis]|uniref:uncharacterized protein LOC121387070 n=1 Tax=Gigantopelta aegis TaxID=1735272 RepID=UPI001B88E3A2|nr:uncharacterized protein LOC121387070 [Gigantopelta aegis]